MPTSLCTCDAPPCVDLSLALEEAIDGDESPRKQKEILQKALTRWGWCHLSIDQSRLPNDSPLHSLKPNLKEDIESLFDVEFLQSLRSSNDNNDSFCVNRSATYRGRTAESGASSATAEPKQSWETKRCRRSCESLTREHPRIQLLYQWTEALHSVALMVTRILELPPNVLIGEDSCGCGHKEKPRNCNVDLLRVFYYDAVKEPNVLGSSAHSDWGSWTVVWQDQVGGLQTYCPDHERWVNVPVPSINEQPGSHRIRFVIHVGDVTSLSMGRAASENTNVSAETVDSDGAVVWPSPKHRVVCPTSSIPRASLVYFAYPPPGVSLRNMDEALVEWWSTAQANEGAPNISIPYERYSLLQNQAVNGVTVSPRNTYEKIRLRPLDDVFAEKWQQVQRG